MFDSDSHIDEDSNLHVNITMTPNGDNRTGVYWMKVRGVCVWRGSHGGVGSRTAS